MTPTKRAPTETDSDEADDVRDGRATATTSAPRRPAKSAGRATPAPVPPPQAGAPATAAPAAVAQPRGQSPAVAESPSATAGSMAAPRSDGLGMAGSSLPMAGAAMGALAAIAAHYGDGAPTATTGQQLAPPDVSAARPSGPVLWDGALGTQYATSNQNRARHADSTQSMNAELERILGGAVDSTTHGRAAIGAIIAEVNTALTALGTIQDANASRQLVISTLDSALQRAGTVLGQGQTAAVLTADRVAALADRYLRESRPAAPPRRRRSTHSNTHGPSGGPPRARPTGQQGQWINEALQVLRQHGYDTRQIDPADIAAIIQHESGGNPHAINLWDSNAAAGIPSKGLMQTIDPTFNAYSVPGHRDIWNPVDNIVAGVRYAIDRYGSVGNVPGIVQMRGGGSYVGY
ncbi:transglycosylase SLT domain-containing protein [Nocardia abscessus]|uniref:transglycosylase SLT domain-containing protein n=1 Tax=Nocardia abscessus TaxID=120957 RepID=UPI000A0664EA|nr:transglycosylase SLT domain-containing protein [Nocardia abscessus]MCC3326390.1 transglycosylase SLT domain-containing protein [Nocardia abscessus]